MLFVWLKTFQCPLNTLEQQTSFTWRSEQKNIDGINSYICYLVDEDGLSYGKEAAVTNHQMLRFPSSLMNSLQWKEDVEQFQMHSMEELVVQDDVNYDHIKIKVMCLNDLYQVSSLRFINNIILFFTSGWKCL